MASRIYITLPSSVPKTQGGKKRDPKSSISDMGHDFGAAEARRRGSEIDSHGQARTCHRNHRRSCLAYA
ncbi:hypothetical protein XA68_17863 [Ophiocordyceps unilateralis]|uniref:Uncharacterized protein n=1 Tax=Ophiocordyceps unilateralis TaxID=268505 RepID=A0A2A9P3U5_OPHUN|nr:hypothetical protein XA68_17863 [Ophiocordyceps unilateralis]